MVPWTDGDWGPKARRHSRRWLSPTSQLLCWEARWFSNKLTLTSLPDQATRPSASSYVSSASFRTKSKILNVATKALKDPAPYLSLILWSTLLPLSLHSSRKSPSRLSTASWEHSPDHRVGRLAFPWSRRTLNLYAFHPRMCELLYSADIVDGIDLTVENILLNFVILLDM